MYQNQRNSQRYPVILPILLSFGTQITLQGQLKDLSLKSAFINVKSSSIHMAIHDDLTFVVEKLPNGIEGTIEGAARISRVAPGDGIAVYFTKMDDASTENLQRLIDAGVLN